MYWPILVFAAGFLVVAAFLAAAGWHVFRYRFRNDASVAVFVFCCLAFFIVATFVFSEFQWSEPAVAGPSQSNTLL